MPVSMTPIQVADQLSDVHWRLNNLYHCIDKKGNCVRFRMNAAQEAVFRALWWRTIVPKSRQKGFTTFFALVGLDYAFFHRDKNVAFQAHSAVDSTRIYIDKILFPLSKMPEELLKSNPTTRQQKAGGSVSFLNGSSINVALSFRSATINMLHCSELGKTSANFPHRARELITGTLPAVPLDGRVIIESTSEGAQGVYYDLCMAAKAKELSGRPLSKLDFKIIFSGWTTDPDCCLQEEDAKHIVIADSEAKYFDKLEQKLGVDLSDGQKAWYVNMKETQGSFMFQEFPADLDECFMTIIEGAYYKDQIDKARADGRIGEYPAVPGIPVNFSMDIGMSDDTAIWGWQEVGGVFRFVWFYRASGEGLGHYVDKMKETGFEFGEFWAPHDAKVREWSSGQSRIETAWKEHRIRFYTAPKLSVQDGIDAVRRMFPHCVFDEAACKDGLAGVASYRKEWDDKKGCWKDKPLHDWAEHPSSALRYAAVSVGDRVNHKPTPEEKAAQKSFEDMASIWSGVGV